MRIGQSEVAADRFIHVSTCRRQCATADYSSAVPHIPAHQPIFAGQLMVNTDEMRVVPGAVYCIADEIRCAGRRAGLSWQRKKLKQISCDRIHYGIALRLSRHNRRRRARVVESQVLPTVEEEGLVVLDGSADCAAVLVLPQHRFGSAQFVGKEVGGLECVVAEEEKRAAMERSEERRVG